MQSDRVRWPFRILAMIIGPAALLIGIAGVVGAVAIFIEDGWAGWRMWTVFLALGINALGFAPALIKASRTGRDPYMSDPDGW